MHQSDSVVEHFFNKDFLIRLAFSPFCNKTRSVEYIITVSINYNDNRKAFGSPQSAYFVGATIIYEGKRFEALNSYNDSPFKQEEEIIFDEKLKVILHYYSNPVLEEVLKEFLGFEGIKCIEIKNDAFHISIIV